MHLFLMWISSGSIWILDRIRENYVLLQKSIETKGKTPGICLFDMSRDPTFKWKK